ncbi:cyclopropane-fatty-acyl-phospholipid synthase [Loktanella sp. 5RATIMAR09]|uniref:NAD(P)/FAD-dependent oxidoreductase n=1 Tax=Loktanella sp. 5RATIMAR09 TaxID=1225655 RepID=UPI0006EB79A0|nr:FAD-dependent oxidoreductase [Loktanella sp. 5RATIMAR09]KQI73433.1 cyclopropane-fatty-acyl-phospholipid synthase [Loktanella sp. 5RATIMAR09]
MPFEAGTIAPKKIAVIGAGISGMGAAHALAQDHQVVLFEAEGRLGGHARTRMAGKNSDQAVDTGFIVFNYANYPHLTKLFDDLDVPVTKSNMSFGASFSGGRMEYGLASMNALFAQRSNIASPRFLRMVRDILKFNAKGLEASQDETLTIGQLLKKLKLSDYFRDHYLLPFSGAIWSTPKEKILDFPAYAMMKFFDNHALLSATGQHQWFTVDGGSREYVTRLGANMLKRGVETRLGAPIDAVRRTSAGVEVKTHGAEWEAFDEVVFATHSDDTLAMLSDATAVEKSVLGAVRYQPNKVVLHSDTSIMPKRRQVWSSWIYSEDAQRTDTEINLTYWMNSLQPWLKAEDMMVTLNSNRPIKEDLIWDEVTLRHPVYDLEAIAAQDAAAAMNGANRTWFCGAWMKNGFHEDGLSSALDVVNSLNARARMNVAAE